MVQLRRHATATASFSLPSSSVRSVVYVLWSMLCVGSAGVRGVLWVRVVLICARQDLLNLFLKLFGNRLKMTKKRKISTNLSPIKVEVKEENVLGNDYLMAKGRLKGVLKQLTEKSDSESDSSDERNSKYDSRKRKGETVPTPYRHTYVMKLFDRSVDLARFEEDTPLYPICRAWMQNQPRNPQLIIKRRLSSPEPNDVSWNANMITDIHRLPPPVGSVLPRIPSPLPEQLEQNKDNINLNYDDCPPVPKDILIRNHLQRWVRVKKKWIETATKNEERYHTSTQILQTVYNKAQEAME